MDDTTPPPRGPRPAPGRTTAQTTQERTLVRECAWCGTPIELRPRAGHQRYCTRSCRQRAYEVRTAAVRHGRDLAAGTARDPQEPVREVVERHTVRTVVRRSPVVPLPSWPQTPVPPPEPEPPVRPRPRGIRPTPPAPPPPAAAAFGFGPAADRGLGQDAVQRLREIAARIRTRAIPTADHPDILAAAGEILTELSAATPGGLDALTRRLPPPRH
ncbi:hypothetical protein [Streptomonospora nanhaiensis]|uniref:hypothetical protein n=1 Tax=Streptomonospora nanhaiensis TaxID=1323731 RepID=UPI001C38E6E2|nr:hypothetical protein [Streptomonospora nanhaiensis]MBV2367125.1 hypothetical protein [Streptomonospora nanhaiensis]